MLMTLTGLGYAIVWFVTCCSVESVDGPFPQILIVPIKSVVEFRCNVNTSQLTIGTFSSFAWNKDGLVVSSTMGVLRSSTITLTVTEENLSGVVIQCNVLLQNPLSQTIGGNATLITYGISKFGSC